MTSDFLIGALGTVAGLCTTGSFFPQVLKTWRERDGAAISTRMYVTISVAFVLWLGYGVTIGSAPMVIFNVANLVLSGTILFLKARGDRAAPARADDRRPANRT